MGVGEGDERKEFEEDKEKKEGVVEVEENDIGAMFWDFVAVEGAEVCCVEEFDIALFDAK